jgi:hypothetical protein
LRKSVFFFCFIWWKIFNISKNNLIFAEGTRRRTSSSRSTSTSRPGTLLTLDEVQVSISREYGFGQVSSSGENGFGLSRRTRPHIYGQVKQDNKSGLHNACKKKAQ